MPSWSQRLDFNLINLTHAVPSRPGVYVFWRTRVCLYVGISKDLKTRLIAHFERCHNPRLRDWIESSYKLQVKFLEVDNDVQRQLRERQLIARYDPVCNVMLASRRG